MPASHSRHIMASVHAERRDCRSHRSASPIDHRLLPSLSHLRTSSEAWRRSTSSQGTPQLRQVVSGTPPWPYMETSSRSSTWQVDRPASKRQQPPTCWSMEAGYQAWSRWKSNATVQRLRDYLTWPDSLTASLTTRTYTVGGVGVSNNFRLCWCGDSPACTFGVQAPASPSRGKKEGSLSEADCLEDNREDY